MTDATHTPSTAPLQAESAASSELSGLNARTARRQKLLLGSLGALALIGGSWFILGGDDKAKTGDPNAAQTIDTAGLVNRDLSQREFVATYGNRLDAVTREQKALKDGSIPRSEIEAQLAALKAENQAMRVDGQAAIDAISAENAELKTRLAAQPASPAPAVPPPAYGPQAGGYDARARSPQTSTGTAAGDPQGGMIPLPGEVKLMSFSSDKVGTSGLRVGRPDAPPVVIEDSPEYLPPNSYAPARVIVGVDASAGVASQTDPLPVVLRITGPARSVMQNGKVLTTRIQGCVVNGAARGDLSSEKVYVKLARMTCDQPGGRVAVSEVKGFISFAGKSGVRGRVVSREGSLISQALLAGIVGGFGRGFSANANSVFSGVTTNPDGSRSKLSAGDILGGGLGQGAADAADTVSKYLIERAEQYQPVVEMPTGIDVEIVFLDGVYVRNSQ
ncbi:TrbI/VirB10 family protein [Novosphingobium taihuense]|uniref:Conjugal transfer pilus assembly protein TraB n=1 Tax=Novosphingobium taihuense TaxID=260085 RepID=A0A7W7A9J3_9SPHN|nr:TrbI/VirB10 family protein [Novosphingobium taihuense]MBB4612727.1 conjugal transfer pilus assembly protein TraB [Novosphingobium taihuense]TWH87924.1 conjugal transfer pilus assembly protein TraB [Novosphingobium taihuense]